MPKKNKKGFRRAKQANQQPKQAKKLPARSAVRKRWSNEQMVAAMDSVVKDGLSQNRAAVLHGVPRSTLKDRLSGRVVHGTKPGPKPFLSSNEESDLAEFLVEAAKIGYGRTISVSLNLIYNSKTITQISESVMDGGISS